MRPPEFTGGNARQQPPPPRPQPTGFNEAAGIHRRKRSPQSRAFVPPCLRFNEAAGIHRRKPTSGGCPPLRAHRCFNEAAGIHRRKPGWSSNESASRTCFNEAAGIHRRKQGSGDIAVLIDLDASMRPPEFTGGNTVFLCLDFVNISCFNEAAGIHRRKPKVVRVYRDLESALQ